MNNKVSSEAVPPACAPVSAPPRGLGWANSQRVIAAAKQAVVVPRDEITRTCDGCHREMCIGDAFPCGHYFCEVPRKDGCCYSTEHCPARVSVVFALSQDKENTRGLSLNLCVYYKCPICEKAYPCMTLDTKRTQEAQALGLETEPVKQWRPAQDFAIIQAARPCQCNRGIYWTAPSRCAGGCGACFDGYSFVKSRIADANRAFYVERDAQALQADLAATRPDDMEALRTTLTAGVPLDRGRTVITTSSSRYYVFPEGVVTIPFVPRVTTPSRGHWTITWSPQTFGRGAFEQWLLTPTPPLMRLLRGKWVENALARRVAERKLRTKQSTIYALRQKVGTLEGESASLKRKLETEQAEHARTRQRVESLEREATDSVVSLVSREEVRLAQVADLQRDLADEKRASKLFVEEIARLRDHAERLERQAPTCVICLDAPPTHVFLPCGHFCTCEACAGQIQECCPMCRARIDEITHVYQT